MKNIVLHYLTTITKNYMSNPPIIPAKTAIESFRDNGYKDTASAISELLDNSIEAKAKNIQILVFEKNIIKANRPMKQISEIVILDDGVGMEWYNGTIMAQKWQSSQEDNLIDLSVINNVSPCMPNSTIVSWSKNMTMFKQSMLKAGFDHRFEYVQATDFLKALNDSITRCNGRKDGSILPMPAPPDAWKNYKMLYNQTEVEWYFEDVYRRLWRGLESVITSYRRENALPIEVEIIQIYNGNGGTMTLKEIETKTKLINLNNEIRTMEKKLLSLRKARKVLEL